MKLSESIKQLADTMYEVTGRRATTVIVGPRIYSCLEQELFNSTSYNIGRNYGGSLQLYGLTVIESIGEGILFG